MCVKKWIGVETIDINDFGFIYKITNISKNKIYIGSKQLYHTRKVKISKKEKNLLNTRKIYKYVIKDSGWKSYTGSSIELNNDIKNGDEYIKEIICVVNNKKQIRYYEMKYQFFYNVLETDSYNKNINGKFFRKDL